MKVIDSHSHFYEEHVEQVLEMMDLCGVDHIINLSMPKDPEDFMSMLEKSSQLGCGRISTLSHFIYDDGIDFYERLMMLGYAAKPFTSYGKIDQPGVVEGLVKRFRREVAAGSRGLKVIKHLGLGNKYSDGTYVTIDDERLDPVWSTAGELGVPVLIHTADPVSGWLPENAGNDFYWGDKQYFTNIELLQQRDRMMARHPDTLFVCAHLGYPLNLDHLVELFERFPNYCVDMEPRNCKLTPPGEKHKSYRNVIIKYADRFCFGTDISISPGRVCDHAWTRNCYQQHLKSFSSAEDGGFDLPDEVLMKVLSKNAKRIYKI